MKRKLLLAALCVVGALGMRAQTDVTSTYISNPSFEANEATVNETTSKTAVSDWNFSYSKNDKVVVSVWNNTNNATGYGKEVTPADETYYSQIRIRWEDGINSGTLSQTSKANLPAGLYQLSIKYKAASSNNTSGTAISLAVKKGNSTLATSSGEVLLSQKRDNSLTLFDDEHPWKTITTTFYLTEEAAISLEATFAANQNSDAIFDDVRLVSYEGWSDAELSAGTYLFQNVASGRYLGPANSWGTQASLLVNTHSNVLALENGFYTIESQVANKTSYYFSGTFMDGAKTNIAILKNGNNDIILVSPSGIAGYDGSSNVLAQLTDPSSANAYWSLIPITDALNNATKMSPKDATYLIKDANFDRNSRSFGSWAQTSGASNYTGKAGDNENLNWQKWNGAFDFNQTVLGLPNGLYQMKAQGFYRPGANNTNSTEQAAYFYAGDKETAIALVSSSHQSQDATKGFTTANTNEGTEYYVPNSQSDASKAFSAGYYQNVVNNAVVTDGTLKIGAKTEATTGNEWTVIDNFRLFYYGPTISSTAEALPASGSLTANKWYYFDIDVDADYDLTLTILGDIVYTTDNTILVEDEATVTTNFAGAEAQALTVGRYYVKSASAQPFSVAAHSFTYELGAATTSVADGKYTQSSTFTVTFPDAASNDPAAAAALVASSKATVNGTEVALTAVEKGFSLDLGTITPATDYAIVIPAGVYGYEGQNMNAAISLTVHTPQILDGTYFLYNDLTKGFLARGMNYGTRAVVDKYGIAVRLVTNADGLSTLQFIDNDLYLGNTWWMYADSGTGNTFKIIPSTVDGVSGYHFATQEVSTDLNAKQYVYIYTGNNSADELCVAGNSADAVNGGNTSWAGTVWQVQTLAQRDAIIATYPTQNIANVITAAGLGDIAQAYMAEHPEITDIKAAATAYVAANYDAVDCTSFIGTAKFDGNAGDWTWAEVRHQDGQPAYGSNFAEVWNATGTYAQTISNLPAGIYKLTVQGYERRKDNNAATALYNAGYNLVSTYLAANGEQVRFTDWNEVAGKPTNTGDAVAAFEAGEAVNTVFVYLDGNTDLTITVKKPNYIWDNWAIFNNFTLTRYEQASAILAVNDEVKYGTFAAPFNVTVPAGVTAYTVTAGAESNEELTLTEVATIEANKPVLLYAENGYAATTVKGKTVAAEEVTNGLLTGVYVETDAPVGSYVLQYLNEKAAFYQVVAGIELPTVGANRAYLTLPTAGSKPRAIYFDAEGEATGIAAYDVLTSGQYDGIYTANGVQIPRLQKGLNVVKKGNKSYKIYVK
jgi:hypothetical protein